MPQIPSSSRRLSVLLLAALIAALALPCFAAATPSAPAPDASFVASLAAPAAPTPPPAPTFLQAGSGCTSNAQCPTGELCCRACGYFGCTQTACFPPMHGHCPLFP